MPKNKTRISIKNQFPVAVASSLSRRLRFRGGFRRLEKIASSLVGETGNPPYGYADESILLFRLLVLVPRRRMLFLLGMILSRFGLRALLLPGAELVLIVLGLGRVALLYRRGGPGPRVGPTF